MIDERREGGVSPRAYFLATDHFGAQLYKRPGNTGNGRGEQKVELAKEFGERGSDCGTCAEGGSYLHSAQGETAFDLPGHVGVELRRIFLEGRAVEPGKSHMLQRHQRLLGCALRPDRVTTDNPQSAFAEMLDDGLQPFGDDGINGDIQRELRRERDA